MCKPIPPPLTSQTPPLNTRFLMSCCQPEFSADVVVPKDSVQLVVCITKICPVCRLPDQHSTTCKRTEQRQSPDTIKSEGYAPAKGLCGCGKNGTDVFSRSVHTSSAFFSTFSGANTASIIGANMLSQPGSSCCFFSGDACLSVGCLILVVGPANASAQDVPETID